MSNPLCFIRLGEPLASNPRLLRFCTQYANDFANTANPVSIPVFLFLNEQWRGGGGGGRVNCERVDAMFNQELTPPEPRPNLILFDLLHCYKKFIHAAGDHHWSRQNARLVRTDGFMCQSWAKMSKIFPLVSDSAESSLAMSETKRNRV